MSNPNIWNNLIVEIMNVYIYYIYYIINTYRHNSRLALSCKPGFLSQRCGIACATQFVVHRILYQESPSVQIGTPTPNNHQNDAELLPTKPSSNKMTLNRWPATLTTAGCFGINDHQPLAARWHHGASEDGAKVGRSFPLIGGGHEEPEKDMRNVRGIWKTRGTWLEAIANIWIWRQWTHFGRLLDLWYSFGGLAFGVGMLLQIFWCASILLPRDVQVVKLN